MIKSLLRNRRTWNRQPATWGIKLILSEGHSLDEVLKTINTSTGNIDAIFLMPSPTFNPACSEIVRAAVSKGLPTGAPLLLDESILISFYSDSFDLGKQAAGLAKQINLGIKASDLPVETGEVKLIINLKTAKTIGVTIPDKILDQAATIIR